MHVFNMFQTFYKKSCHLIIEKISASYKNAKMLITFLKYRQIHFGKAGAFKVILTS